MCDAYSVLYGSTARQINPHETSLISQSIIVFFRIIFYVVDDDTIILKQTTVFGSMYVYIL